MAAAYQQNIVPIMQQNGDGNKPVWVTETGYNTMPSQGISEAQQAIYLTQSYNVAKTIPNVARLYWYDFDSANISTTTTQDYYGIYQANTYAINDPTNMRAKPAYAALQLLTAAASASTSPPVLAQSSNPATINQSSTTSASPHTSTTAATQKAVNPTVSYLVDGVPIHGSKVDTAMLSDGKHSIEEIITDPNGKVTKKSQVITVNGHKPFWRNVLLRYKAGPVIGLGTLVLASLLYLVYSIVHRRYNQKLFQADPSDSNIVVGSNFHK